jgi:hypothetical protein
MRRAIDQAQNRRHAPKLEPIEVPGFAQAAEGRMT